MRKPTEQPGPFPRVGLTANPDNAACASLVREAARLIRRAGRTALTDAATASLTRLRLPALPSVGALTRACDLLIVVGGDGTLLRVARDVAGSRTPILGINAGSLGFLTDIPASQLRTALPRIWAGETRMETRSLIEARGVGAGRRFAELAFNDFVITRGASPRLVELELLVDREVVTRYRGDGLIISTPTGSTAYSLAAGGAVVYPGADVFALTPICPHTLSSRSVVVSLSSIVAVRVLSGKVETTLTADGQKTIPLAAGDVITIRRSRLTVRLLHLAGTSFFETLRRKLNWSGTSAGRER